jgi:hypothetical protein
MFQGTLPAAVHSMLFESAADWKTPHLAVACSGNFTIERLFANTFTDLRGCDISIYSCALGAYFARQPFRLELRPEHRNTFDWIAAGLQSQPGAVATLMLLTSITETLDSKLQIKPNAYYARLLDAYRRQWSALLDKTITRLEFHAGDAVDWLPTLPESTAVVSFPPFFAGGYTKMWAKLDALFDWNRPVYQEIFDERRQQFISALTGRPCWALITPEPLPHLSSYLRGIAQTSNRGVTVRVYSSPGRTRVVTPRQNTNPVMIPRLSPGDEIGSRLHLVDLSAPQFQALRSQYLNPMIKPASGSAAYGVMVDNKLVGAFAFQKGYRVPGASPDTVYLLTDFAIAPSDYTKLAKLVLYAALSHEAQLLAERLCRQRIRHLVTTAFSDHPVSMKYRGLFQLLNRKENTTPAPGEHRYMLNYLASAGRWSLTEGLKEWRQKHAAKHLASTLSASTPGESNSSM